MLSERCNITPVTNLLVWANPKSVLDVGVGFGTYGFLARAYLDVWRGRLFKKSWQTIIDGIEYYKEFENPVYNFCYNTVFYGDAKDILPVLKKYDVVILFHVLEHMEKNQAIQVLAEAHHHAEKMIIVGVPATFFQTGCENWPAEQHRCHFTTQEFRDLKFNVQPFGDLGVLAWKTM